MKPTIASLYSVALLCPLVLTQCDKKSINSGRSARAQEQPATQSSFPATNGGIDIDISPQNKNSIKKRSDGNIDHSRTHPEPWLHKWDPAGRPASDLKLIFGEPIAKTTEMISFNWSGLAFDFKIKDGKTIALERRLGEVPLQINSLITKRSGLGSAQAFRHMEAWLSYWDPIGCTPAELKAALGPSNSETAEKVTYSFDSGFGGNLFEFLLDNGKIVRIARVSME